MVTHIVLGIDSESLRHPKLIGLGDENLESQKWLSVYSDALLLRAAVKQGIACREVWVISTDSMDGINVAAAVKRDNPSIPVKYIAAETTGSVMGRCEAAGINCVHGMREFIQMYNREKLQNVHDSVACEKDEKQAGKQTENLPIEEPVVDHLQNVHQDQKHVDSLLGILEKSVSSQAPKNPEVAGGANASLQLPNIPPQKNVPSNPKKSAVLPTNSLKEVLSNKEDQPEGMAISIVSGSGGTGKSTLALSMAMTYQRMGLKTLLLDADLQFGDMAYLMGFDEALTVSDLLTEPKRIAQCVPENGFPALIGAPEHLEQSELLMSYMGEVINYVKRHYEIVVINTGAFWTEQHAQIIEASDATLFLLDQRPSSVRACSRALDLCARCGIATQSFRYALNRCSRHALLAPFDVSCALQGATVEEIREGGREVGELLGASLPRELFATKNAFCASVSALCERFLPEDKKKHTQETLEQENYGRKKNSFFGLRKRRVACL